MRPTPLLLVLIPLGGVAAVAPIALERIELGPEHPRPVEVASLPPAPVPVSFVELSTVAFEPDVARSVERAVAVVPATPPEPVDEPAASAGPPAIATVEPGVRVPDLLGLVLDSGADEGRFASAYARAPGAELARAQFRLARLIEAFHASGNESPVGFLLPSDFLAVVREHGFVSARILEVRPVPGAGESRAEDRSEDYAHRYATLDSETLFIAGWKIRSAMRAEMEREVARRFASGAYAVVPADVLGT